MKKDLKLNQKKVSKATLQVGLGPPIEKTNSGGVMGYYLNAIEKQVTKNFMHIITK